MIFHSRFNLPIAQLLFLFQNVVLTPPVYDNNDDEKYRKSIAICFLVCCCIGGPLIALLFLPAIICYFMVSKWRTAETQAGECVQKLKMSVASFPGSPEREMYMRGEPGIFSHVIMM